MTTILARPHASAHDAIVELNFSGDHAISLGGRFYTTTDGEMAKLNAKGLQPTTWFHHEPTMRIMSVPGNVD